MQTVELIYLPRGRHTSSAFEPHGLEDGVVIVIGPPPVPSPGDMVGPSVVGPAGLVRSSVDVSAAVVVVVDGIMVVVVVDVDTVVVVVVVVDDATVVVVVVVEATVVVVVVDAEVVIGTPVAVIIRTGKQQSSVESKLGKLVLSQPRGYSEGQ